MKLRPGSAHRLHHLARKWIGPLYSSQAPYGAVCSKNN